MELRGVSEGQTGSLLGHGLADFGDAVTDADYRGLACGVEVSAPCSIDDPAALAANGDWESFAEIAREERGG